MHEQLPYNVTPGQGWARLKPALDAAMPPAPHKRRLTILWWSMATVLITGGSLFVWRQSAPAIPAPSPLHLKAPATVPAPQHIPSEAFASMTDKDETTSTTDPSTPLTNVQEKIYTNDHATAKGSQSASSGNAYVAKVDTKNSTDTNRQFANQTHQQGVTEDSKEIEMANVIPAAFIQDEAPVEAGASEAVAGDHLLQQHRSNSSRWITDPLYIVANRFGLPEMVQSDQIHPASVVAKNRMRISPFVDVAGFAGQHGGVGHYVGGGINISPVRNWSVQAGLGYRSFSPGATLFSTRSQDTEHHNALDPILSNDPMNPEWGTYVLGQSVNKAAAYESIQPLVDVLRQWQVSCGVTYNVSRRWFAEAGVGLAFGTRGYSTYPILSQSTSFPTADAHINRNMSSYDVIRTSMASWRLGAGIHIGRHLDLYLHWQHTAESYLINEQTFAFPLVSTARRTDFLRGLQLGVKYML